MEDEETTLMERLRESEVGLGDPNIAGDPLEDGDVSLIEEAEPGDDRPIEV